MNDRHLTFFFSLPKMRYFRTLCDLQMNTCGQKVVPIALHHCRKTAACNELCEDDKNYVCGSDNKFYKNECEMKRENCG